MHGGDARTHSVEIGPGTCRPNSNTVTKPSPRPRPGELGDNVITKNV